MPTTIIPGPDAVKNLKQSPLSAWPSRADAQNRIEPFCEPAFEPGFTLKPGEKIFTIGSCFARNIEKALALRGFDVVTRRMLAEDTSTSMFRANILNNYGVPSILNEFSWALDLDAPFDEQQNFFETSPGRFTDIHLPASIRPASFEETKARRDVITHLTAEVANCRVVVMTLGLIEVWFDTLSGLYLNYSPRRALVAKNPDRFQLHVLSYAETLKYMHRIVALLQTRCRNDQKILLTVSPVPLTATYTGRDVLVANAVSKSVLRAAADEIVAAYNHIDYFPSYESVTLSARDVAWEEDQRHVEQPLIDLNIGRMIDAYIEHDDAVEASEIARVKEKASVALSEGGRKKAMRLLEPLAGVLEGDAELAALYVEACLDTGRVGDAETALAHLPDDFGTWRRDLLEARVKLASNAPDEACDILKPLAKETPHQGQIWNWLAQAYIALKRHDEALLALKSWQDHDRAAGAPMRLAAHIHADQGNAERAEKAFRSAMEAEDADADFMLDYAEFLISQKRMNDAKIFLENMIPETRWQAERKEQLSHFTS
ncbi:MAG: GSCFA domain-containing protein [Hyphomicrobiales bacterium]